MTNNLPAKSNSRGIQQRHVRHYANGKTTIVNKEINKNTRINNKQTIMIKQRTKKINKIINNKQDVKQELTGKKRIPWQTILKPDDGNNLPISVPKPFKPYTIEEFNEQMDYFASRNEEEFEEEYIIKPLNDINTKATNGEITIEEAKEEFEEAIEEANNILEDDQMDSAATIYYGPIDDQDIGTISQYTTFNSEDIDVEWKNIGGWRGYNEVKLPKNSKWKIMHEDVILSMSEDSQNLKIFQEKLEKYLKDKNIEFATVFTTGSNLFSQGITFMTEKSRSKEVNEIIKELKKEYRKEEDFNKEVNPFTDSVKELKNKGLKPEHIKERIKGKVNNPTIEKKLEEAIKNTYK